MDTTCQYASNCPAPSAPTPLTHVPFTSTSLPYTGLDLAAFVGFAVALIALGLLFYYSERIR